MKNQESDQNKKLEDISSDSNLPEGINSDLAFIMAQRNNLLPEYWQNLPQKLLSKITPKPYQTQRYLEECLGEESQMTRGNKGKGIKGILKKVRISKSNNGEPRQSQPINSEVSYQDLLRRFQYSEQEVAKYQEKVEELSPILRQIGVESQRIETEIGDCYHSIREFEKIIQLESDPEAIFGLEEAKKDAKELLLELKEMKQSTNCLGEEYTKARANLAYHTTLTELASARLDSLDNYKSILKDFPTSSK